MIAPTAPPSPIATTMKSQPKKPAGGCAEERGQDGKRHADHAEEIALPARLRMRQAAQRQDEEDARDEIEEGGEAGAHGYWLNASIDPRGNSTPTYSG